MSIAQLPRLRSPPQSLRLEYIKCDINNALGETNKPLVWLYGEVKTPPFSQEARIEAGFLLRRLQQGENLGLPHSRPMPSVGPHCHELRVRDAEKNWRIIYRIDNDAILILEVFNKTTRSTPDSVIEICQKRLSQYDRDIKG
ncbi:type II toxin-antitoxin system RelE/ParE family toxin [Leptolyngbya ohadii]|uniref:type II toxin-antitoxin system RelE/ParE family toxin n=1 Tax=Leptolyngbya ohadii TaxID=1962290 RepID=UPI0034E2F7C3